MNKELQLKFLTNFKQGNIKNLLEDFSQELECPLYNIYKGLIYLNLKEYNLSSKYFFKSLEISPSNDLFYNNIKHLPMMYQKKKYIINLECHLHSTHSFSNIANNFIKSLTKLDNVDLRINHINSIGIEDKYYKNLKQIDDDTIADLTIRICIPHVNGSKYVFDCSKKSKSKNTLIFLVSEAINVRFLKDFKYNVFLMTPSQYSKNCIINTHKNIDLKNIINVIPHGIDYLNHNILNEREIINIKKKYGIQNEFVFLHISCNSKGKNVEKIIKAFLKLEDKNLKLIIKINSYNNQFNPNIFSDLINKNIILIQQNYNETEMNELYNICDCYISASIAEGFNMPVLEAGSYGKIVICPENSPTDEFTCDKGCIKISNNVRNDGSLDISMENIYKAMYQSLDFNIKSFKNDIIVHHLKYNWDLIIKNVVDQYCISKDNFDYFLKLIEMGKPTENDKYLQFYYSKLVDKNINLDNLFYNYFINNYSKSIVNLYFFDIFKGKSNIFKKAITDYFLNNVDNDYENIQKSINLDYLLESLYFINNNEEESRFIKNILQNFDINRYTCILPTLYFLVTYLELDLSKKIKSGINQNIQRIWKNNKINITNQVTKFNKKYSLCIISTYKDLTHNAIYRFIQCHLEILSESFTIDIFLLTKKKDLEKEKIEIENRCNIKINNIYNIDFNDDINFFEKLQNGFFSDNNEIFNNITNFDKIVKNNYLCCYIPVIGCEISSIYLSNLKIAPIQFGGYGHPISSYGSKNNYFIVSNDIEHNFFKKELYSEEFIYVKGLTTIPKVDEFKINYNIPKNDNYILISCNYKKMNYLYLNNLKKICKNYFLKNNEKLHLVIFPGFTKLSEINYSFDICKMNMNSDFYTYSFEYIENFSEYMQTKYLCKISFDSYPYGGFTTILENLKLHIPTIAYEGVEAINNFPSYIYRLFDLTELIVYSYDEYIELADKLLNDTEFYNKIYNKIKNIDFSKLENIDVKNSFNSCFQEIIDRFEAKNNN